MAGTSQLTGKEERRLVSPLFRVAGRPRPPVATLNEQLRGHNFVWDPKQRRFVRKGSHALRQEGGR